MARGSGNFDFLREWDEPLADACKSAEELAFDHPVPSLASARLACELLARLIVIQGDKSAPTDELLGLVRFGVDEGLITPTAAKWLHTIRIRGNAALHDAVGKVDDARDSVAILHQACAWFAFDYRARKVPAYEPLTPPAPSVIRKRPRKKPSVETTERVARFEEPYLSPSKESVSQPVESELAALWKEPEESKYMPTAKHFAEGAIVKGRVVSVNKDRIIVDFGAATVGVVNGREFRGRALPALGDVLRVRVEECENEDGLISLSSVLPKAANPEVDLILPEPAPLLARRAVADRNTEANQSDGPPLPVPKSVRPNGAGNAPCDLKEAGRSIFDRQVFVEGDLLSERRTTDPIPPTKAKPVDPLMKVSEAIGRTLAPNIETFRAQQKEKRQGPCSRCGSRCFTTDSKCFNCEVGIKKSEKEIEQYSERNAAQEAARKKGKADTGISPGCSYVGWFVMPWVVLGMVLLLSRCWGGNINWGWPIEDRDSIGFDVNQPSTAPAAPNVDAWRLFMKLGRRWCIRTTKNPGGPRSMQLDTISEVVELRANEAVVRVLVVNGGKIERDEKMTVRFDEEGPGIPYTFKLNAQPYFRPLSQTEYRRTEAGGFDCDVYRGLNLDSSLTYVWTSHEFKGLLVEARCYEGFHAVGEEPRLIKQEILIEFFDPP